MAIAILLNDRRFKGLAPTVKRAAEAALADQKVKKSTLTLVLSNDKEIRALNKEYRGKDKPTNVLAFPDGTKVDGVKQLGDIILAYETLAKEAVEQGKSLKHHLAHLTVHGVLHLLGFEHGNKKSAGKMEALEIKILSRMGIANPYESE